MPADGESMSPELRAALAEAMRIPLRFQVLCAVREHPGVTINQIARRIDTSARRIRHQVEILVEAGLIVVDTETSRRNARERHYRSSVRPLIVHMDDAEEGRQAAMSSLRLITLDFARAVRAKTFSNHEDHATIRIPGEVDERGWAELVELVTRAMEDLEAVMVRSAERLEASGEGGTEAVAALLLFEAPGWDAAGEVRHGPRPSPWLAQDDSDPAPP